MSTNLKLAALAAALFAGSLWAYSSSVSRGDRFNRGQKFLPNLNPDEVGSMVISQGDETVTLRRRDDQFLIAERHDYPAKNETVNRFLRDLLELGLEKEVGTGDELALELEIEPPTENTADLKLLDLGGEEMVHARFGKVFPEGSGRYLQRRGEEAAPIYLSASSPQIAADPDSFLDKELIDVQNDDIARIEGGDFVFSREEPAGPLTLEEIPDGKKEKAVDANKARNLLSRLTFDKVYLADDDQVRSLPFQRVLVYELEDGTGYSLAVAEDGERTFLRIRGHHNVGQVQIAMDTPDEELKEKANQLTRVDEIEQFNAFHDSWVYELSESTAGKLSVHKEQMLQDA